MEKLNEKAETGCCERFNPEPWDGKQVTWKDKLFLRDHVFSVFHIPLNFGQVMKRDMEKIQAAGALADEPLMLSDENSLWGSDVFIAVGKDVPGAQMERLSGTYLMKVFEGPFQNAGTWAKEMGAHVNSTGKTAKKLYFWYTTCPACAKVYGKSYTVLVAQI